VAEQGQGQAREEEERLARYAYERLSAQDLSFLLAEDAHAPMHLGALAVLESGPLRREDGGIDIARYRQAVESVLHWIPRYRQKLAWVPLDRWPVWVDDRHFDLGYHIRHLSLPRPGSLEQLREMAGRIFSRHLDRSRPLWEIWVIEGLHGGEQFALLNKIHHCMIDGAAGADLSQILLSPSAQTELAEPVPYMPRPAPGPLELLRDSLLERSARPRRTLDGARRWLAEGPGDVAAELRRRAAAVAELSRWTLARASDTPINGDLSPHRRFDWLTMPLADARELGRVLECSVNDIVLATVAGALRRYLFRRRVDTAELDFRVAAPVSVRREEHRGRSGNHVSSWILRMPVAEAEPLEQLARIREQTAQRKRSESALGIEMLMQAAEWLPARVIARGVSLARGPANMIVTNVPGPQFPLYQVGARLLGLYPVVPLLPGSGLGIALFSYEGKLCWGFNADYELVPDLPSFVADLGASFEALRQATVARFLQARTAAPETAPPAESPLPRLEVCEDAAHERGVPVTHDAPAEPEPVAAEVY
jgi:diacylglycerol O-acyltransferase